MATQQLANPMDPVQREDSASKAAGHIPTSAELVDDKIGVLQSTTHLLQNVVFLSCCLEPNLLAQAMHAALPGSQCEVCQLTKV